MLVDASAPSMHDRLANPCVAGKNDHNGGGLVVTENFIDHFVAVSISKEAMLTPKLKVSFLD